MFHQTDTHTVKPASKLVGVKLIDNPYHFKTLILHTYTKTD